MERLLTIFGSNRVTILEQDEDVARVRIASVICPECKEKQDAFVMLEFNTTCYYNCGHTHDGMPKA